MIKSDKCPNCGAPIHIQMYGGFKCDYCGSERINDTTIFKYGDCKTFQVSHRIPAEFVVLNSDMRNRIMEDTQQRMAHMLADGLLDYMIFAIDYGAEWSDIDVRGVIKIKPFETDLKEKYAKSFPERFENICENLKRWRGIY